MEKRKSYRTVFVTAAVLGAALLIGGLYAKYIRSVKLSGNVTFSASLADEFILAEHKTVRQPDGGYVTEAETVSKNDYLLMPGVDIPKDPYIIIGNKSSIPAYLFIEAVGTNPDAVKYEIDSGIWKSLGIKGAHGGDVYVYTGGGSSAAVLDKNFDGQPIGLIKDNILTVSDSYAHGESFGLDFYGYMAQTESGKDASQIFTENFNSLTD